MSEEIIDLIDKENKSKTDEQIIQNSEYFLNRVSEIRNDDVEAKWPEIAKRLSSEFKMKIDPRTLEKKYLEEASIELQVDAYAEKQFTKYIGKMAERYDRLIRISDKMSMAAEKVIDKLSNEDIETADMDQLVLIIKMIKPIEPLLKTTLTQLQFVREEQDKITTTLRKNKKEMSDDDIREKTMQEMKKILETWEAQGKIKIYDRKIIR